MAMAIVIGYFTRTFFLRESQLPQCLSMAKDSQLRDCLEVYSNSLSSGQVFLRVQLKTFSKFSGWTFNFFAFELCYSLFHILMIKSSNRVDRALFNFLFNSFENSLSGHSWFCT